jgi:hypothetical protein
VDAGVKRSEALKIMRYCRTSEEWFDPAYPQGHRDEGHDVASIKECRELLREGEE